MLRLHAAFIVAACFAVTAQADQTGYLDGLKLKQKLDEVTKIDEGRGGSREDFGFVHGYVAAIHDANSVIAFCPPPNVKLGQEVAIVQKYIRENPADWGYSADVLVTVALAQAFPCPKKK